MPVEPMPLAWFDYPQAHVPVYDPTLPPPETQGHPLLFMLTCAYFAGVPQRPSPEDLARLLRSSELDDTNAFVLYQLFGAIYMDEIPLLLSHERLTVHELARAVHLSGVRRAEVIHWLNQFAVPPVSSIRHVRQDRCGVPEKIVAC